MRQGIWVFSLLATLAAGISVQAQHTEGNGRKQCEVWGQVITSGRFSTDGMEIELTGKGSVPRQRTHLVNGAFDFKSVPTGIHQFRVLDHSGQVILERSRALKGTNDSVYLRFPYNEPEGYISVAELGHKTPRRALDMCRFGVKATFAGELQRGIDYFQKAVAIDPQFADAEQNLSAVYGSLGRFEDGLQHSQRAFEIRPESSENGHTLALFLLLTKRYAQAEALARAMLAAHQARPEMYAVLAEALIWQQRSFPEAFDNLERATAEYPVARLLAAGALIGIGRSDLAAIEVNAYIKLSASECEQVALEKWEADLGISESKTADEHLTVSTGPRSSSH